MTRHQIAYKEPKKILTPASGFLYGYTHSLNPYTGCLFGCSYCYVRQSPVGLFRGEEWGEWVDIKKGIHEKYIREMSSLRKRGKEVTIFMASATDPYQSVEYKEKITRALLEAMVEMPPDFLFVQTRSPLVTRDIDLFLKLKDSLRLSVTVETDLDEVRKNFSPQAPPIQARLKAIGELQKNDLPVQAAVAPVLPFSKQFPETLAALVNRIVIDDFYTGDGSNGKRTERLKIKERFTEEELEKWYGEHVHEYAYEQMKTAFSTEQILISKEGFMPY
ncbi:radical SAM protein [Alkalihalophilus pseudofirmus]|uniref:SPL family radical SAM protein n=1 Tax=Alkalihalophilus pseudofirmus TaxID=79885 RepID=UPI00259BCB57|nr:radical SAM protein [Alkalihalophilus pseudofirmus]WEG17533.1 radical SAM protein [Alkalihalophilus pseudofirmus]